MSPFAVSISISNNSVQAWAQTRMSYLANSALARAKRILHPPENSLKHNKQQMNKTKCSALVHDGSQDATSWHRGGGGGGDTKTWE